MGSAIATAEIARVDASCSTFILVHSSLAMLTIGNFLYNQCKFGVCGVGCIMQIHSMTFLIRVFVHTFKMLKFDIFFFFSFFGVAGKRPTI
jgi:hypothetical protein